MILMKKLGLAMAILMAAGVASADNSNQSGNFALGVTTGTSDFLSSGLNVHNLIMGKYRLPANFALTGGVAYVNDSNGGGKINRYQLGVRKYFGSEDFTPFVGGFGAYTKNDFINTTAKSLGIEFGAEYFIAKRVSIEGSAGIAYSKIDSSYGMVSIAVFPYVTTGSSYKETDTFSSGLGINFYF